MSQQYTKGVPTDSDPTLAADSDLYIPTQKAVKAYVEQRYLATGGGTVGSVAVVSANGFAGTVANPNTTPSITLSTTITGLVKGSTGALTAASAGTDYLAPAAIGTTVQAYDADLTAIAALSGTTGLLKKTAADTWSLDTSAYVTLAGTETLTNKTLTTPVINGFSGNTSAITIGTDQFYKDTSGNVGIGTSSPNTYNLSGFNTEYKFLTVDSGGHGTGNDFYAVLNLIGKSSSFIDFGTNTVLNSRILSDDSYLAFSTNATGTGTTVTERLRIDSSGNVGIGTSSPTAGAKLDVNGSIKIGTGSSAGPGFIFTNSNWGMLFQAYQASPALGDFTWLNSAGTQRMIIDTYGNVGIGVGIPQYKCDLQATSNTQKLLNLYPVASATSGQYCTIGSQYAYNNLYCNSEIRFGVESNSSGTGFLAFATGTNSSTERLRIDSSGNVGIGTSTFGTSAATVLAIATGTAPSSGPADTVQFYSSDRSAGNTIPSFYCEGSGVVTANTTAAATHRIAIRINGTIYYFLANTAA